MKEAAFIVARPRPWPPETISRGTDGASQDETGPVPKSELLRPIRALGGVVVMVGAAMAVLSASRGFGADASGVGQVDFPVTASPQAQEKFNRAVSMLHSFWYEELDDAFSQVSSDDPRCGMAYWGLAMSQYHPLWSPPDPEALRKGWNAVQRAKQVGGASPREQDYIEAIEVFYRDWRTLDHGTRSLAYSRAMERLVQRYPDDEEAALFYALSLLATASPSDRSYSKQKKAAEILERIRVASPDHPGVIHYIIHAYDSPPLAHLALPAARRYARIAPEVPHAQHMPSHIFTRLGLWEEAIASNEASVAAAKEYARKVRMKGVWDEQIHAMDYLVYAALQCGQDSKARTILDELQSIRAVNVEGPKVAYPVAAIPARYALERRQWQEASRLANPTWFNLDRYPWAEAMIRFARGVGIARSGHASGARADLERIDTIHGALVTNGPGEWALPTKVLQRELSAWIASAEGRHAEAVRLMTEATELEESTEKPPITPGPLVPAREQLGEVLLAARQPSTALREFEVSLRSAPNRFGALYGAAKAAEASQDADKARTYFARLVDLCGHAEGDRAALAEAKAFLKAR